MCIEKISARLATLFALGVTMSVASLTPSAATTMLMTMGTTLWPQCTGMSGKLLYSTTYNNIITI